MITFERDRMIIHIEIRPLEALALTTLLVIAFLLAIPVSGPTTLIVLVYLGTRYLLRRLLNEGRHSRSNGTHQ